MRAKKKLSPAREITVLPLPEKLWDVEGVRRFLGVSRMTVFRLIKKQGLPHLLWERTLRFHPEAIARWLAEQQQQAV